MQSHNLRPTRSNSRHNTGNKSSLFSEKVAVDVDTSAVVFINILRDATAGLLGLHRINLRVYPLFPYRTKIYIQRVHTPAYSCLKYWIMGV